MLGSKNITEIHEAAESGSPEALFLLLDHGADVNLPDERGRTPLHFATEGEKPENMRVLIDRGADVNRGDKGGQTPICIAARQGNIEAISLLLTSKADPNQLDSFERTPLYIAVYNDKEKAVELLLEHEVDVTKAMSGDMSPLHIADVPQITEMLLDHHADPNIKTSDQWTPLHFAAYRDTCSVANILLKAGASINETNDEGDTALHLAMKHADTDLIRLLLRWNADTTIINEYGASCASLAVDNDEGDTEVWENLFAAPLSPRDVVFLYWSAIRIPAMKSLAAILGKADYLLKEVNEDGITALQSSLRVRDNFDEAERIATILMRYGASPFTRNQLKGEACLKREFTLRNKEFVDACLDSVDNHAIDTDMGFTDLRIIMDLEKPGFWTKTSALDTLKRLQSANSPETDNDGWNISHFLQQAGGKVPIQFSEALKKCQTKTPSGLLMPSFWASPEDEGRCYPTIAPGGHEVSFPSTEGEAVSLRANHPFPPRDRETQYFEITISDPEDDNVSENFDIFTDPLEIALGFCGEFSDLKKTVTGWSEWSVGYHGNNGRVYNQHGILEHGSSTTLFRFSDTVGCGIDYVTEKIFFTLGGRVVFESAAEDVADVILRKLYPTVSHRGAACKVEVNFGERDFTWSGGKRT